MRAIRIIPAITLLALAVGCTKSSSPEEDLQKAVAQMPWIITMLEHCDAYKSTKKDAEKKDLFNQGINGLRAAKVTAVTAEVEKALPIGDPKAPTGYSLMVKAFNRVTFMSDSQERPIEKDTPVYDTVSQLKEGDCVIFSGDNVGPGGRFEQGKLCDTRYFINFSEVERCPEG